MDKSVKFEYLSASGVQHEWELVNWHDDADYIKGIAVPGYGYRTFRKDRVVQWLPENHLITNPAPRKKAKEGKKDRQFEVCFTGWPAPMKTYLLALAEEHGFIVRKSVTANLDFLVAGENAGPKKMQKATDQGVIVLDKQGFSALIFTGEIGS